MFWSLNAGVSKNENDTEIATIWKQLMLIKLFIYAWIIGCIWIVVVFFLLESVIKSALCLCL